MKIKRCCDTLLIQVNGEATDEIMIQNYARKLFKTAHINSHSILINNVTENLSLRKDFLHWLYLLYAGKKKQHFPLLKAALFTDIELPIKIKFIAKNPVEKRIEIDIDVLNRQSIRIKLLPESVSFLDLFIRDYFKEHISFFRENSNNYHIMIKGKRSKQRLLELLRKKAILHRPVRFSYDLNAINALFDYQYTTVVTGKQTLKVIDGAKLFDPHTTEANEAIKKKYKTLLNYYHPDRVYNQEPNIVKEYTAKFQSIKQAYDRINKDKAVL